jgi:mediator of RNA polymerase II transcription subunit 31
MTDTIMSTAAVGSSAQKFGAVHPASTKAATIVPSSTSAAGGETTASENVGVSSISTPIPAPAPVPASASASTKLPENRFELELEFVQSLASPAYLHHLATQGYFQDEAFLSYLRYLRSYWTRPEYAKYITYPHCLFFLDLAIEKEAFRKEISQVGFRNFVHEQQFMNWQYRSRMLYGAGSIEESPDADAGAGAGAAGNGNGNAMASASAMEVEKENQGQTEKAGAMNVQVES